MRPAPPFAELIAACTTSAVHLEMRDTYLPEDPEFLAWDGGERLDIHETHREWYDLVRGTVGRGVRMQRARIASEPLAPYIRFEHAGTARLNVAAGEEVRWLPRRQASDIALPGNDFWVFDDRLVRFGHFDGEGRFLDNEITEDRAVVTLCASAFEAVWERAVPHREYRPS